MTRKLTQTLLCAAVALLLLAGGALAAGKEKEKNDFPNATRKEPKTEMSGPSQTAINAAYKALDENKNDKATELLEKVLNDPKASPYARALALQGESQISWSNEDYKAAIAKLDQAIKLDALPNKSQFQAMYQVAQLNLMEEKYDAAVVAVTQWSAQSGAKTAESLALQGNAYYRLDKFQDAIDSIKQALSMTDKTNEGWLQILMASYYELQQYDEASKVAQQQLAKDPTNKKLIQQLSSIYINNKQEQKALELMMDAKAKGLVTTEDDYKQLAQLYNYLDKSKEAAATINEGITKNAIKPGYDIYKLLGDAYAMADDDKNAIDAYNKAAPFAKDGNVYYLLGHRLLDADRSKEAKDALTQAIAKGGLKQEGEAYILLGNAEYDLGNTTAAIAAYEKAKSYPSTKKMAESWLKSAQAGAPRKKKK
jgi:tetratricopeptide (TPR) repeat protein